MLNPVLFAFIETPFWKQFGPGLIICSISIALLVIIMLVLRHIALRKPSLGGMNHGTQKQKKDIDYSVLKFSTIQALEDAIHKEMKANQAKLIGGYHCFQENNKTWHCQAIIKEVYFRHQHRPAFWEEQNEKQTF